MIISLVLGVVVFPLLATLTGGLFLIISVGILLWGFSDKSCPSCGGTGTNLMITKNN